jgi:hypothetical protein
MLIKMLYSCYDLFLSFIYPMYDMRNNNPLIKYTNNTENINKEANPIYNHQNNSKQNSKQNSNLTFTSKYKCGYCNRYISEHCTVYMYDDNSFCTPTCRNNLLKRNENYNIHNQSKSFSL